MSHQLTLWDEGEALAQVSDLPDIVWESRARAAFRIAARLVTLRTQLDDATLTAGDFLDAVDVLGNRAANLFTAGQHAALEVPA